MSEELEKVKPTECKLMIGGKEREIKFAFSAWAKLEDEYGSVSNFENIQKDLTEKPFRTVPHLIWVALKDKEGVTEETILDEYGMEDIEYVTTVLMTALNGSLPTDNDKKKVTKKKVE